MKKSQRYKGVRYLIEKGEITKFREIFEIIPKTGVAEDLKITYPKFVKKIESPSQLKVDEITRLAKLIGVSDVALFAIVISGSGH